MLRSVPLSHENILTETATRANVSVLPKTLERSTPTCFALDKST